MHLSVCVCAYLSMCVFKVELGVTVGCVGLLSGGFTNQKKTSVGSPLAEDENLHFHVRDHIRNRCLLFDRQISFRRWWWCGIGGFFVCRCLCISLCVFVHICLCVCFRWSLG